MQASVLEPRPRGDLLVVTAAVLVSMAAHGAVASGVSKFEAPVQKDPVWVEVAVQPEPEPVPEPQPEPEPPPKPEPEPPPKPPPPEPEVVEFEETDPDPVPETPQPRVARPIQGLSANSFAPGSGGPTVRAGNTTATRAGEVVDPSELGDFAIVPFTAPIKTPRIGAPPKLTVPQEIIDQQIQGRVEVELTIGADGSVLDVVVVGHLHPAADAACVEDLRHTHWRPGTRDDVPVVVTGVPYSCRYEMAVD